MAMEECRTEASIGIEYSESVHDSSEAENTANSTSVKTVAQADSYSPSERKKRKRISPHSTPKVAEGMSNSLMQSFCSNNKFTSGLSLFTCIEVIINGIHHIHVQAKVKIFFAKASEFWGGKTCSINGDEQNILEYRNLISSAKMYHSVTAYM